MDPNHLKLIKRREEKPVESVEEAQVKALNRIANEIKLLREEITKSNNRV